MGNSIFPLINFQNTANQPIRSNLPSPNNASINNQRISQPYPINQAN